MLGTGRPFSDQLPDLEAERAQRTSDHAPLLAQLDDDYSRRHKRYRSFLRRLTPSRTTSEEPYVVPEDEEATEGPEAVQPLPLSDSLHDFFLRLFRR